MVPGISLANKCQLLFSLAVLVILAAALSVPWFLWKSGVREGQYNVSRQVAAGLIDGDLAIDQIGPFSEPAVWNDESSEEPLEPNAMWVLLAARLADAPEGFLADSVKHFDDDPENLEHTAIKSFRGTPVYRYARALRQPELQRLRGLETGATAAIDDPIVGVLVIDRTSGFATGQLLVGRVFIIATGVVAGLLAIGVFYLILTKLILSPVRTLRETTEKVQQGDLSIRSTIQTGDEFEQLSEAFNAMLADVAKGQAQLRSINETLDLKVTELSEANVGLYESNRLKGEFLANVSHELRTPLNSIIGFAELLRDQIKAEAQPDDKRPRYVGNIITSGRDLLQMINQLLDMAKIEAGRMEVMIESVSVQGIVEGLMNIMRPQAEEKRISLEARVAGTIPIVETDPGKLQQILYNFLANAIKFTPDGGTVTLSADRVKRQDNESGVRLAVADTGPGIPLDMQDLIFEKFRQVDSGHTREFSGTGLGLAICRDLAELLGATVSFVSEPEQGSTFFVDIPVTHQPDEPQPLMG